MASSNTTETVNIVHGTQSQLVAFIVLNMWPSHFGLPALLAIVFFSKRIQRHPTFLNLCIAFILVGLSSSILVYTGQTTGPEPGKMICLFQASLVYGIPALASVAVLTLVLQMWCVIRASSRGEDITRGKHFIRLWIMLIAPYAAWVLSIIATAMVGVSEPESISRDRRFFYCSVKSPALTNSLTIFSAAILLATLVFETWTLVLFYKRWVGVRKGISGLRTSMELNLPIRVLAFGVYVIIALSLSLLSIKSPESPAPDLIISTAASVVILIFGTQPDILRVLRFWHKDHSTKDETASSYSADAESADKSQL